MTGVFRADLTLAWRRGIIPVYLGLLSIYALALLAVPAAMRGRLIALLIFVDTSGLGFFFVGATVQWEKRERIFEGLFTTPLSPNAFLAVRVCSFTALSLAASLILIATGTLAGGADSPVPWTAGAAVSAGVAAALGALLFTIAGVAVASVSRTLNGYFALSLAVMAPLFVPVLALLEIWWHPALALLPTGAMVRLMMGIAAASPGRAVMPGSPADTGVAIAVLVLWSLLGAVAAARLFGARVARSIGDAAGGRV